MAKEKSNSSLGMVALSVRHCILSSGSQRNQPKGLLCIPELHRGHLNWETETKERLVLGHRWVCATVVQSLTHLDWVPTDISPLGWLLFHPLLSGSSEVESRALCIVAELCPWPTSHFETWTCERFLRKREDTEVVGRWEWMRVVGMCYVHVWNLYMKCVHLSSTNLNNRNTITRKKNMLIPMWLWRIQMTGGYKQPCVLIGNTSK